MLTTSRVPVAAFFAVVVASAVTGYDRDGLPGAVLWGLACAGSVYLARSTYAAYRRRGAAGAKLERWDIPPEVDAALRGLAHDLRSPIATAAAACAALDEHVGKIPADDDVVYLCRAVRQSLDQARERLLILERYRLQPPPEAQGPGVRAALSGVQRTVRR
jgi:hypothetical protein